MSNSLRPHMQEGSLTSTSENGYSSHPLAGAIPARSLQAGVVQGSSLLLVLGLSPVLTGFLQPAHPSVNSSFSKSSSVTLRGNICSFPVLTKTVER